VAANVSKACCIPENPRGGRKEGLQAPIIAVAVLLILIGVFAFVVVLLRFM
jgi:hypothetical protein